MSLRSYANQRPRSPSSTRPESSRSQLLRAYRNSQTTINNESNTTNNQTTIIRNDRDDRDDREEKQRTAPQQSPNSQPTYFGRIGDEVPETMRRFGSSVARVVPLFGKLVVASVAAVNGLYYSSRLLTESRRYLTDFNSSFAYDFAKLDVNRIFRNVGRSKATETSNRKLVDSLNNLEDSMLPFQTIATEVVNNVVAPMLQITSLGLDALLDIGQQIPLFGQYIKAISDQIDAAKARGLKDTALHDLYRMNDKPWVSPRNRRRAGGQP